MGRCVCGGGGGGGREVTVALTDPALALSFHGEN